MPLKNGKLYIDETTSPKTGISLHEIARCIGVGSQDLATLACHKNNNRWSWSKPVRSPYKGRLSKEQFASEAIFFGFDSAVIFDRASARLMDKALSYRIWPYLHPELGSSDMFRVLDDYNGYNHYAKPPYNFSDLLHSYTTYAPIGDGFSWPFRFEKNEDAEIKITDFAALTGSEGKRMTDWRYAILYRKQGDIDPLIAFADTSENIVNDNTFESVEPLLPQAGTYECVFVITTEQSEVIDQQPTMWLSGGAFTFTLIVKRIPVKFDVSGFGVESIIVTKTSDNISINTAPFDFVSTLRADIPVDADYKYPTPVSANLNIVFYAYDADGELVDITARSFEDALFFSSDVSNPNYNDETKTETFFTNLTPVLGDRIDLGDFGGKVDRVAQIRISFEPDAVLTNNSNTYIVQENEPVGGFVLTL
jgi:hypothetical protein